MTKVDPTESEEKKNHREAKVRRDWLDVSHIKDRRVRLQGSQCPRSKAGKDIESPRSMKERRVINTLL